MLTLSGLYATSEVNSRNFEGYQGTTGFGVSIIVGCFEALFDGPLSIALVELEQPVRLTRTIDDKSVKKIFNISPVFTINVLVLIDFEGHV